jgi:AraC family transcriptional regulator
LGTYRDAGVERAFDRLMRWAAPRGLDVFANYREIPWDDADVTPDDRCRFDACLIVPGDARLDGGVNWQSVPAGLYAVLAAEVENHDFDSPWTRLLRDWLPDSGFQPADRPRIEVYLTDGRCDPDGRWQIEVCLPVEPL